MPRFKQCLVCRGAGKIEITVKCPDCDGRGTIQAAEIVAKLGDLLSESTLDRLAQMIAEDEASGDKGGLLR